MASGRAVITFTLTAVARLRYGADHNDCINQGFFIISTPSFQYKENYIMIDRLGIYQRFAKCYKSKSPYELAIKLGIKSPDVYQWKDGQRPIPWDKLKDLLDEQQLRWDWLIEGKGPKNYQRKSEKSEPLDRHAINQRFLSLFPNMSHAKIGKELGVNPGTISKWRRDLEVPWERLKYAVDNKGVTWEWLLEGR